MSEQLSGYTDKQLKEELNRREKEKADATPPEPIPYDSVCFLTLYETLVEGYRTTIANGYENEELWAFTWEAAMTAVFGDPYWAWRRKQGW